MTHPRTLTGSRRRCCLLLALGVLALVGCRSAAPGPEVVLAETDVLADQPLRLRVTGLEAGAEVVVEARTAVGDAEARATFHADDSGRVDLVEDAPGTAGYAGASGYGLLRSLHGTNYGDPDVAGRTLRVSVSVDDEEVGTVTQQRRLRARDVELEELRVEEDGVSGYYAAPGETGSDGPAVLVLGGSEGGAEAGLPVAELLASHGYPSLSLAYFGAPGLPGALESIPIEYVAGALTWLADRPGVDPDQVVALGVSRGSEAALLAASRRPDLVAGVVGLSPSGVAVSSVASWHRPAWTWQGRPVPFAHGPRRLLHPGAAAIDVAAVDGPLLLVCGREDRVWPSCPMVEDVQHRLAAAGRPPATVLAFDDVGHEIGLLPPGVVVPAVAAGEDPDATGRARVAAWRELRDYLAALGR